MTLPVKWFNTDMEGAPGLEFCGMSGDAGGGAGTSSANSYQDNYVQGEFANWLKACLVDGFIARTATSVTHSGGVVTVDFGAAHAFPRHCVIEVSGANEAEYNGEFRVTSVTANTLTYSVGSTPAASPATGTVEVKVAPAGWSVLYDSTDGLIVFDRPASDASPYKVVVRNNFNWQGYVGPELSFRPDDDLPWVLIEYVDNYVDQTTYDRVSFCLVPPQRFRKSETYPNGAAWLLADPYCFWDIRQMSHYNLYSLNFCGDIVSARPGDRGNFLAGNNITQHQGPFPDATNGGVMPRFLSADNSFVTSNDDVGHEESYLLTSYAGTPGRRQARAMYPFVWPTAGSYAYQSVAAPNPVNSGMLLSRDPVPVIEQNGNDSGQSDHFLRGFVPGLLGSPQDWGSLHKQIITGIPGFNEEPIIFFKTQAYWSFNSSQTMTFIFRLGQWRDIAV